MAISDGSANAPAGTPQVPTLLDSYGANRPSWAVAGVDYYVGAPQGLALKDPSTISMAGVTVDAKTHHIYVTGNNVTLSGYDFSLNGGWGVVVYSSNVTITNSNFAVGSNHLTPINATGTAGNLTVTNSTIDGGMDPNTDLGTLISYTGTGTLTVEYTWLKNAGVDMIDVNNNPTNIVLEYNLFQNGGVAGAHGDFLQVLGKGPYTATILYNTTMEAKGLSSQGFMIEPDVGSNTGVIAGGEIGYNTMTGANNAFTGITVADLTGAITVHDNYFDPSQTIGGLAFGGVRGGINDSSSYTSYVHNVNMTNGAVVQDANAPSTPTVTTPSAPVISSWSPDTGATGDGITDANKLTVKGTAAANSTVTVYDGSTSLGTATANSSGAWTFTTSALSDAKHVLTAKATVSGATSAASSSVSVTVDTVAPAAPVETSSSVVNTNHVQIAGTAEANSTITIYDGTTVVGTGVTNSSGVWNVTTSALSTGSHVLKATATDVAGNVSAASAPLDPVIGTAPVAPAAPAVSSLTAASDSGVVGDHITNDATPTVTGTAVANSTVKVYDGSTLVGTTTASASGAWSVTTSKLADGSHSLTATDTDASSGLTSTASSAFSLTIDTKAPSAPTEAAFSQAGAAVGASTSLTDLILKGTAEANSAIKVFDGSTLLGTAKADGSGAWSLDTGAINAGVHSFTATATDAAGNTSAASTAVGVTVATPIQGNNGSGTTTPTASSPVDVTCAYENWNHVTSIKGTADANSYVKIYDGATQVGTAKADASGDWHFSTKPLSDTVHTLTAQEVSQSGASVGAASGAVIVGSSGSNVLTSTSGDDYFIGNGHPDTFVFAANFGHDVIKDFVGTGSGHDTIQFSSSEFANFASVLSHASQVGHDVVIAASGGDTLTLKHTSLSSLSSNDFHFA